MVTLTPEIEKLAEEVAVLGRQSPVDAIREALIQQKHRLSPKLDENGMTRSQRAAPILEAYWASLPPGVLGKTTSKEEIEDILGFGPDGV